MSLEHLKKKKMYASQCHCVCVHSHPWFFYWHVSEHSWPYIMGAHPLILFHGCVCTHMVLHTRFLLWGLRVCLHPQWRAKVLWLFCCLFVDEITPYLVSTCPNPLLTKSRRFVEIVWKLTELRTFKWKCGWLFTHDVRQRLKCVWQKPKPFGAIAQQDYGGKLALIALIGWWIHIYYIFDVLHPFNCERSYYQGGKREMFCYHKSNSDSLLMTHSTVEDLRNLEKMKLNESGRHKLGR